MGGRDLKYSLLTAFFMVTDQEHNPLGELSLKVKPDDGDYIICGQGMTVNRINIQEHDKIAILYKNAKPLLFNFLKEFSTDCRLTPVGHGVRGDIEHVTDKLISQGSWQQFCSHHYLDTSVVLQYLRGINLMPHDNDGSVEALAQYFGIEIQGTLHDASVDVRTTCELMKRFNALPKLRFEKC